MVQPQLGHIAAGGDLPIESRQQDAIPIVQGRIERMVTSTGEVHAEDRVKIYLCGMALPIAGILKFNFADVFLQNPSFPAETKLHQKFRLLPNLLGNDMPPDNSLYGVIPCDLVAQLPGGVVAPIIRYQLPLGRVAAVAEDHLNLALHQLREKTPGHGHRRTLDDDHSDLVQKDPAHLLRPDHHVAHLGIQLAPAGNHHRPPAHSRSRRLPLE